MKCLLICLLSILSAGMVSARPMVTDTPGANHDTASHHLSFEAEAYYYILPGEKNTTTFMGYADYKGFHSELRYNYEDLQTVSVFGGYRFNAGRGFRAGFTPVLGFAVGNTDGIIPGFLLDLTWNIFDFHSESEYVVNFEGSEKNYFYTWSELGITPVKNIRTGISANRTRLIHSSLDLQRGVFAQFTIRKFTSGIHYFNPFSSDHYVIVTIDYEF